MVMLRGGFRPSVAITLVKGTRRARVLLCLQCHGAWVLRSNGETPDVPEQASVEDEKAWLSALVNVAPPGDQLESYVRERLKQLAEPGR